MPKENLELRKVEALESIADSLEYLTGCDLESISGNIIEVKHKLSDMRDSIDTLTDRIPEYSGWFDELHTQLSGIRNWLSMIYDDEHRAKKNRGDL